MTGKKTLNSSPGHATFQVWDMGPITGLLEHLYPHLPNRGEKEALLTELIKYNSTHRMLSGSRRAVEMLCVLQIHVNSSHPDTPQFLFVMEATPLLWILPFGTEISFKLRIECSSRRLNSSKFRSAFTLTMKFHRKLTPCS